MIKEFGAHHVSGKDKDGCAYFLDAWGTGPFRITYKDKSYLFEDSDRFGPVFIGKSGKVLETQPMSERHPFWAPYHIWRNSGRPVGSDGVECIFDEPCHGTYWIDDAGISHFLTEPNWDDLGYRRVEKP